MSVALCQDVSLAGRPRRIVSLFSGYGGLEMGIQSVLGGEVVAHVEFDEAPSRILAHHYPGVPNLGDITTVDWAAFLAEHPELGDLFGTYRPGVIVCGGFPCQDLSLAGRRAGMRPGTRSGLWADFLKAIDALRPELAVIENVRGLLSGCAESEADSDRGPCPRCADPKSGAGHAPNVRALGRVLIDLASIGYDARWVGLRAADAGAPHARFRVFVVAHPNGLGRGAQLADVRSRESDALGRAAEDADGAARGVPVHRHRTRGRLPAAHRAAHREAVAAVALRGLGGRIVIAPKPARPSKADEADAYELATLRDKDTCQRCRRDCGPSARDHRQNRHRGNTVVSNLQILGLRCHQWKTEHPKDALEQGWAVPSWASPSEWPARRWLPTEHGTVRLAWVLYDDLGMWAEITDEQAEERMKGAGW